MGTATRPTVAVTMGDPAGVGPEIIVKTLAHSPVAEDCQPILFGNLDVLRTTADSLGLDVAFSEVSAPEERYGVDGFPVITAGDDAPASTYELGQMAGVAGRISLEYFSAAVELVVEGRIDAITTAPVSKEAISLADIPFTGHLEYLAGRTGTKNFAPLLGSGDNLRVVHLSSHHSLRDACSLVTRER